MYVYVINVVAVETRYKAIRVDDAYQLEPIKGRSLVELANYMENENAFFPPIIVG